MANANNGKDKSFNVVDKSFGVQEQDDEAASDGEETAPDKPAYVIELEQAIGEKDQVLKGVIAQHQETLAEFDKAKERLAREVGKEVERNRRGLIVDFLDVVDNLERALE
jgi:molecular chaperone GrpE (heat shock protein)